MLGKRLSGSIIFNNGIVDGRIYGGSYLDRPRQLPGVKMAVEIPLTCDVSIPTKDFSVPPAKVMERGMIHAYVLLQKHGMIYVGCMGGVGRTGLFMALMVRWMNETMARYSKRTRIGPQTKVRHLLRGPGSGWGKEAIGDCEYVPPIAYVRKAYSPHAVETEQQKKYVTDFDMTRLNALVGWL